MVIGVTGGVGSGKSTVLDYLEKQYQAFIIRSDDVAKEIMEPGTEAFRKICDVFPQAVAHQKIDRNKLAEIIFSDASKRMLLNAITHPATIAEINRRIETSPADIVVVESALFSGTGIDARCDALWYVFCEREKRIRRLMENRGYSRKKAESIIAGQPSEEEYRKICTDFIDNSYSIADTQEQIDRLLSVLPCGF